MRLHPLSAVVGATREVIGLLAAGATGLLVGGPTAGLYFTSLAVAVGLVHHLVTWVTFTYTLHADRIELRRAFIGRSVKNIPLERIRSVDVSTTLLHRVLGLAVVHIDAASGDGDRQDGTLNAVSLAEGVRLRHELLGGTVTLPEETVYARVRPRWYLYAPLSGAYLLTPFALAGSFLGTLYNVGDDLGLINANRLAHLGDDVRGLPPLLGFVLAGLFALAMPVASVVVFTVVNWDFTLRAVGADGTLVARRGLLTRRTVTLERRRIRGVEVRANPFERLAGVVRLGAVVTGLGDASHRGRLFPAAPSGVAWSVAARVLGGPGPALTPHPRSARSRRVLRAVAAPLAATGAAVLLGQLWLAWTCAVLALLCVPLGYDRYRQLGHGADGVHVSVRSGTLSRRHAVVEHRAVVGWRLRQSVFQRRLGLATLVVAVGAGEGGYAAIDLAESDAIALAARITPAWVTPFLEHQPAGDHAAVPG
ncbi:MAG TPA: PH domain-containing protein [Streptosporangiaceae bacterium]|nr:PH domain-containing protein [Streptosporangiaceae bacterium]